MAVPRLTTYLLYVPTSRRAAITLVSRASSAYRSYILLGAWRAWQCYGHPREGAVCRRSRGSVRSRPRCSLQASSTSRVAALPQPCAAAVCAATLLYRTSCSRRPGARGSVYGPAQAACACCLRSVALLTMRPADEGRTAARRQPQLPNVRQGSAAESRIWNSPRARARSGPARPSPCSRVTTTVCRCLPREPRHPCQPRGGMRRRRLARHAQGGRRGAVVPVRRSRSFRDTCAGRDDVQHRETHRDRRMRGRQSWRQQGVTRPAWPVLCPPLASQHPPPEAK